MIFAEQLLATTDPKMTQAEKAWLAWRLVRDLGGQIDWITFAMSLKFHLKFTASRSLDTFGTTWTIFNDGSVLDSSRDGSFPTIKTLKECGLENYLTEWRIEKGL